MQSGNSSKKIKSDELTKELGLTRGIMNSLALFIYNRDYPSVPGTVEIFNEWASACGVKFSRADEVCSVLEHVRKLAEVDRSDLEKALRADRLLTCAGGNYDEQGEQR